MKAGKGARDKIHRRKIRVQLEAGLRARLHGLIDDKMGELLQAVPGATIARDHASIELLSDQVALTIRYEKPAAIYVGHAVRVADMASREVGSRRLGEAVADATKKKKAAGSRALGKVARPGSIGTRGKLPYGNDGGWTANAMRGWRDGSSSSCRICDSSRSIASR